MITVLLIILALYVAVGLGVALATHVLSFGQSDLLDYLLMIVLWPMILIAAIRG